MKALKVVIIFFLCGHLALAQNRIVTGRVSDAATGEPIPFASVFIKGSQYGTSTDEAGNYQITAPAGYDTLGAFSIGYRQMLAVLTKADKQTVLFPLLGDGVQLADLVIRASKESLEDYLWRNIQENKARNSKSYLSSYEYEVYNKIEIDLKNLPDKMLERKVLKPFVEVLQSNFDTLSEDEPFLPLLLTENISDVYYNKEPKRQREVIKATKVSGMQDESMGQFLTSMYQEFSVYENSINILGKEFISPLARTGKLFYDFKVTDTLILNNELHYRMTFKPRTKGDAVFYGDFLVSEKNFALKDIHLFLPKEVNINFIRRLEIAQEFEWVQDTMWMLSKEKIVIEFTPLEKLPSVIGRKTVTYNNFVLNDPGTSGKIALYKNDIVTLPGVLDKDDDYWLMARHAPLSQNEEAIYGLIDSVKNLKAYKTWTDIFYLVFYGYVETGPIDIGPLSNFLSFNSIEQVRFRIGGRTNDKLSDRVRLSAYMAYGIRDKRFKGGGEVKWLAKKEPHTVIGGSYRHDLDYASTTTDPFGVDNFFSTLYRRKIPVKMIFIDQGKVFVERDWNYGFQTKLTLQNRRFRPETFALDYLKANPEFGLDTIRKINQSEAIFNLHWGFRERFLGTGFTRSSMGTKHPLIDIEYVYGFRKILGSEYNYHKAFFSIRDEQAINPIGRLEYKLQAGKVFGKLPYMLLEVPNGNETFFLNSKSYNLMNSYEFFVDRWISLELTHHFDGFFLNRIPGVRKAKLREVIYVKALWGSAGKDNTTANREGLAMPMNIRIPYIETGFGIENILKIFRVDFLWRATYRENPDIVKWGIRLGTGFSF
jgi:hypothetical protein